MPSERAPVPAAKKAEEEWACRKACKSHRLACKGHTSWDSKECADALAGRVMACGFLARSSNLGESNGITIGEGDDGHLDILLSAGEC